VNGTTQLIKPSAEASCSGGRAPGETGELGPVTISTVSNSRLVYSTDSGDHRRETAEQATATDRGRQLPNDGVVRVFRDKSGRRGKIVTVVRGLPAADLDAVASDLKRQCGAGGAIKEGAVEIQGDHREKVAARLGSRGYTVKLAGG
jgi:translation initiation factor 1